MKKVLILHILFFNALIASAQIVALSISNGTVIQCDTWTQSYDENHMQSEIYVDLKAEEKMSFSYFDEDDSMWKNDLPIVLYSESGFTTSETSGRTIINVSTSGCYKLYIVLDINSPSATVYEEVANINNCQLKSTVCDIYDTICGSYYLWKNQYLYASGDYQFDTLNVAGGDSILTLHLTLARDTLTIWNLYTCSSELPYVWQDVIFDAAGDQVLTLTNAAGCDSIVHLHLESFEPTYGDTIAVEEYAPFIWYEHTCTATGYYVHTFNGRNIHGCDSILTLYFTLLNSTVDSITSSTATLKWLPDSAVTQYDINVYTSDTLFAQYLVDGNGQVLSSQHFAPAIYHQKLDTTISSKDYFVITLDGLSAGTDYTYTIEGVNAQNTPIYHEAGSFKTLKEKEEGLFDVISDNPRKQTQKFIRDGILFIERNGKTYNAQGVEMKP